uniref:RING-type E3 ubiquitin transferase n=1 Tax=Hyaloperonospora arabidopsidis (strain Emoy2) TaxID=559515 RepID=M4BPD4_HYAAE
MSSENGRVVMIVRAASPRRESNERPDTAANAERPLALSLGVMEADWRQQQFQRQRMQLLSMAIFLCFLVLFFDNRAGDLRASSKSSSSSRSGTTTTVTSESNTSRSSSSTNPARNRYALPLNAFNDTDRMQKIEELERLLQMQAGYRDKEPPLNVTGIYSGTWDALRPEDYDASKYQFQDIVPYLKVDHAIQLQQYTQPVETGHTWLFLKMKVPASKELMNEVAYVTGQLVIYEEQASLAATILPVQGVFLRNLGTLTLFGNSPDSSVQILYRRENGGRINGTQRETDVLAAGFEDAEEEGVVKEDLDEKVDSESLSRQPRAELMNLGVFDGVPTVENRDEYAAIDISPPRHSFVSRFRSSDSFSDQCVSIVEMTLVNDTSKLVGKEEEVNEKDDAATALQKSLRHMRLEGTLASENCGLYLKLDTTFQEENLNVFFAKASRYAVIMTFVAMAEIYFLLRQLQVSSTQATAAKVSLLTIGQQAIVDSYLCLGHLTLGIVAQNVFAAFASVAFVKLIIFSVFEMRYLLIIWKARRPQGFSEGWLTLRRELTTLYSRFYLTLLVGLCIFYNFSVRSAVSSFPFDIVQLTCFSFTAESLARASVYLLLILGPPDRSQCP